MLGLTEHMQGISAPIVGAAFENATLFLAYANLQRAILSLNPGDTPLSEKAKGKQRELSLGEKALAGAGAGTAASFVLWV